jgi:tRNA pseudouridine13 synthase
MIEYDDSSWQYLTRKPTCSADFRAQLEHFQVEEQLSFEPCGQGEHVFLWIEKAGQNTQFVAKQLAKFAKVKARDVSYSGLKDRHAVTRQWFCVPVPIKSELDWQHFELSGVKIFN